MCIATGLIIEEGATDLPSECDYLIVGGGASGLAFADSLLAHCTAAPSPVVVIADSHRTPGGQWNDSYSFVRLHQPSAGYGVETEQLEPNGDENHLASREEIVRYYQSVVQKLEKNHGAAFVGGAKVDLSKDGCKQLDGGRGWEYKICHGEALKSIVVKKRLVDARYLQPDLPVDTKPTFAYDASKIVCAPVNVLNDQMANKRHFVVVGAGKTGMDAIYRLLTRAEVHPDNILWVKPNEMWITARENIGSCMELLRDCAVMNREQEKLSMGAAFLEWEKQGRVYRLDTTTVPTKFRDATLDKDELEVIRRVTNVVRNGRVREIRSSDGALVFGDGTVSSLPWDGSSPEDTLYVHCSAGAFNYTKQSSDEEAVFAPGKIVVQDVYGTPGFCFVGSIIGRLEAMGCRLTDKERNEMCLAPRFNPGAAVPPLGPSGGDLGDVLSSDHGFVQRLANLRKWRSVPELRKWMENHRLFNLKGLGDAGVGKLVDEAWTVLEERGIVQ
jgi:hypothetical protein